MQDDFIEPLDVFLEHAITQLQEQAPSADTVLEVLETLSAYEAYQQISKNATAYPQLGTFLKKKEELLKRLPELNAGELKTLTLDLTRELKHAIVERYYPPLENVSPQNLPDAHLTRAVVKANAQHTKQAIGALQEQRQQRHREFVHNAVYGWGPLLSAYYSRLGQSLDVHVVDELVAHAQAEVENELIGGTRQEREKLTAVQRDARIQQRLDSLSAMEVERMADRVLARSLAVAFYGQQGDEVAEKEAKRLEKRIDDLVDIEKPDIDTVTRQQRRATIEQELRALPESDPERFIAEATNAMRPLRERYIADLVFISKTTDAVIKNTTAPPHAKTPDIDFMVLVAFDKAAPVRNLTEQETHRIIRESIEATHIAATIESDTSQLSPGKIFQEAMLQSPTPTTRVLGGLFGLLSEAKQEQIVQTHFEKAWNTVVAKIANNDAEVTRKLGQEFVQSGFFQWLKDQGAKSFADKRSGGGATTLFDNIIGPVFGSTAVATAALGNAEQSVISYVNYARQNQPLFDRIKEKEGLESLKKLFAEIQKEHSVKIALAGVDFENPQRTLPVIATLRSLGTPHVPMHLPHGGMSFGAPGPKTAHIPVAAQARSSILLRYLDRVKQAEFFSTYSLYIHHLREQFPSFFQQSGVYTFVQGTGRWAVQFAGQQLKSRAGKAVAGTVLAGLAKLGVSRAAITAIGGVMTGGVGLAVGFLTSAVGSVLKTLTSPDALLRRLRGEESLRISDTPAILAIVILVLFIIILAPPDFYSAIMAERAPSGGGEGIIICTDPDGDGFVNIPSGDIEVRIPMEACLEMARNTLSGGAPFDCAANPDAPECDFQDCNPSTDPNGCAVPIQCGGLTCTQGPYPISSYTHRNFDENAVDLSCGPGSFPVTAGHSGTVIFVGWRGGYGNAIIIKDSSGSFLTIYAHLAAFNVSRGQTVAAGYGIGSSDNTGNSTGSHLHYERRDARAGVCDTQGSSEPVYSIFCSRYFAETDVRSMLPAQLSNSCPGG